MKVFQLATHIQSGYVVTNVVSYLWQYFHTHVVKKNGSLFLRGGKNGSIRKSQKELQKTKTKHTPQL